MSALMTMVNWRKVPVKRKTKCTKNARSYVNEIQRNANSNLEKKSGREKGKVEVRMWREREKECSKNIVNEEQVCGNRKLFNGMKSARGTWNGWEHKLFNCQSDLEDDGRWTNKIKLQAITNIEFCWQTHALSQLFFLIGGSCNKNPILMGWNFLRLATNFFLRLVFTFFFPRVDKKFKWMKDGRYSFLVDQNSSFGRVRSVVVMHKRTGWNASTW